MAQTKKKRRRKHRGTQGGRIDTRPSRGRPRSRAEAKARARSRQGKGKGKGKQERVATPPTWGSAFKKSIFAGGLFFVLLVLVLRQEPLPAAALSVFMLGFYVPMAFFTDRFFYERQQRKDEQARIAKAQERSGQ